MQIITKKEINELKLLLEKENISLEYFKETLVKCKKVITICGPTCCGKSNLAINLAILLNTDIISVDSMQVYKGMDIGTDKITTDKYKIKQYMIDLFNPDHYVTAVEFRDLCRLVIEDDFFKKNNIPILVGGSGLYLRAILDDLKFTPVNDEIDDNIIRENIKNEIKLKGIEYIFQKLLVIDPVYCKKISGNDERRIIRALEVYKITGKPFSYFQDKWNERKSIYNCVFVGLVRDKKNLNECIASRIDKMFSDGLLDEVKTLVDKGYGNSFSLKQAVGYKELLNYLTGLISYEESIQEVIKNTRKLAKKQLTWFNADSRINWIRIDNYYNIGDLISDTIKSIWKDSEHENS